MLLLHWELPFPIEMVHISTISLAAVPPSGFSTVTDVSLTQFPFRQSEPWVEILRAEESRRSKEQEMKATDRGANWKGIKMSVMSKESSNVNYEIIRGKASFFFFFLPRYLLQYRNKGSQSNSGVRTASRIPLQGSKKERLQGEPCTVWTSNKKGKTADKAKGKTVEKLQLWGEGSRKYYYTSSLQIMYIKKTSGSICYTNCKDVACTRPTKATVSHS